MSAKQSLTVNLRPLNNDIDSLKAAGETLSLSFTDDPLIGWLYADPLHARWGDLRPGEQKWQQYRVRSYILEAFVMEAVSHEQIPRRLGVCVLHPPKPLYRGLNPWWWGYYLGFYWDSWMNQPDEHLVDKDRLEQLYHGHDGALAKIQARYGTKSLYYLEIASVRPDTQGTGVGGKLMDWVVKQVGDTLCYLECTNSTNIPFYEKYGFKLVEEIKLEDKKDHNHQCVLYYMVRDEVPGALDTRGT